MEDKKKQSVQWDFSSLQNSLECGYGSPERLLLEAYKGLLFLTTYVDSDLDIDVVRENVCPAVQILDDVYRALTKKEAEEFALEHPNINRTNK